MNQKRFSNLTAAGIVFVLVALISYSLLVERAVPIDTRPGSNPNETPKVMPTPNETADWRTYRNEKYGFTLTLPASWKGYRTVQGNNINNSIPFDSISFELPTSDKNWEYGSGFSSVFAVNILPISDTEEYAIDPYTFKNDKYVFNFVVSSAGPDDLPSTNVEDILSTFKFVDINDTADWQTYNDNKIGFEFKYPPYWSFSNEKSDIVFDSNNKGYTELVTVRKFELSKDQSYKDLLVENTTLGEGPNHPDFSQFELKKIGNEDFYYIFSYLSEGQFSVSYWYIKGSNIIQFELYADAQGEWQNESWKVEDELAFKDINQILSSFKFTVNNESADWKIYKNEEYGFEFRFPQSWNKYTTNNSEVSLGNNNVFKSKAIDFGLGDQHLFAIVFLTPKQWDQIDSEDGPAPVYIDRNDKFVFAYISAQEIATTDEDILRKIGAFTNEQIFATFRFTE